MSWISIENILVIFTIILFDGILRINLQKIQLVFLRISLHSNTSFEFNDILRELWYK